MTRAPFHVEILAEDRGEFFLKIFLAILGVIG